MKLQLCALLVTVFTNTALAQTLGADYVDSVPPTIYEDDNLTPQNMDFNKEKNQFPAHPGWYKDQEIHYYKFRMYTPNTYDGLITAGSSFSDVPIGKVYLTTTSGGFDGVVGDPICQFHTSDGNDYSDFVEIVFVDVDSTSYTPGTFKSEGDITEFGNPTTESGIIVNMPVVPTGSTLQDPANKSTVAPIDPVVCLYKGKDIQTFVFEVTDSSAADFFASTRTVDGFEYAIPVVPNYATASRVTAIPLWHVNQYTRGVEPGEGGGPSPDGQRNVINLDRGDDGYSPLWEIAWVSELPINYMANEASSSSQFSESSGFNVLFGLPMFVNCPDIGAVGGQNVMRRDTEYDGKLSLAEETNWIMGSAQSLILRGGVIVTFEVDGKEIATTETNLMGAYEYEMASSNVPRDTTEIKVVSEGEIIRTVPVAASAAMDVSTGVALGLASLSSVVVVLFM